jgi:hypothetical protein
VLLCFIRKSDFVLFVWRLLRWLVVVVHLIFQVVYMEVEKAEGEEKKEKENYCVELTLDAVVCVLQQCFLRDLNACSRVCKRWGKVFFTF